MRREMRFQGELIEQNTDVGGDWLRFERAWWIVIANWIRDGAPYVFWIEREEEELREWRIRMKDEPRECFGTILAFGIPNGIHLIFMRERFPDAFWTMVNELLRRLANMGFREQESDEVRQDEKIRGDDDAEPTMPDLYADPIPAEEWRSWWAHEVSQFGGVHTVADLAEAMGLLDNSKPERYLRGDVSRDLWYLCYHLANHVLPLRATGEKFAKLANRSTSVVYHGYTAWKKRRGIADK